MLRLFTTFFRLFKKFDVSWDVTCTTQSCPKTLAGLIEVLLQVQIKEKDSLLVEHWLSHVNLTQTVNCPISAALVASVQRFVNPVKISKEVV